MGDRINNHLTNLVSSQLSSSSHLLIVTHTRYTNNNKQQENEKFSDRSYHVQDIQDMKHKNINMSWDYRKFSRHPVAAEKFEMI